MIRIFLFANVLRLLASGILLDGTTLADEPATPDGDERVAAFWCTGKVGMTGTSYNGTIPLAAATTGVDGLEAIIPVAPNTACESMRLLRQRDFLCRSTCIRAVMADLHH